MYNTVLTHIDFLQAVWAQVSQNLCDCIEKL